MEEGGPLRYDEGRQNATTFRPPSLILLSASDPQPLTPDLRS